MVLRELISCIYTMLAVQVLRWQMVMLLAVAMNNGEPGAGLERLQGLSAQAWEYLGLAGWKSRCPQPHRA